MKWQEATIDTVDGAQKAIAPEIISASRSTDIPAFYSEWFMNRLRQGYVKWLNPFNQRPQYISFKNTRVIVFWSKNPKPMMEYLGEIDDRDIAYYFQFTLNDYENEKLEPGVPPLNERIKTFRTLSERIGKERAIWRFDPLILTTTINLQKLLDKIKHVGNQIAPYTDKLVFSFVDIGAYRKVQNNLSRTGIEYTEFSKEIMETAAQEIAAMCKRWGIKAATCAEAQDFGQYGIEHNKCVDDELILRLKGEDAAVRRLLGVNETIQSDMFAALETDRVKLKDPGQRAECGCVFSKDIGQYNTCAHLCVYCYANTSEKVVRKNINMLSSESDSII